MTPAPSPEAPREGGKAKPLGSGGARVLKASLIVVIAVLLATAIYTPILIAKREAMLQQASRYNIGQTLGQAAVEFARLQAAVGAFAVRGGEPEREAVRLWLDIMTNRVGLLEQGEAGAFIRSHPEHQGVAADLKAAVAEARSLVAALDEPGVVDRLMEILVPETPKVTRLASVAHAQTADRATRDLQGLGRLHWTFAGLLIGLIVCGFALVGVLIWHNRLLRRAHREVELLVSDLRNTASRLAAVNERLLQAQRMEALGRLAGGVAHDFNNVLQAVLGGAKLIARRPEDTRAVRRLAAMIVEAAGRGASVARRLLAFARRDELRAEAVDARALLDGLREVLAHTLGVAIQVRVEVPPGLPPLLADRGQLETVLVNLGINARDAMALQGGGRLTLSASPEEVPAGAEHRAGLAPGSYLRLTVIDTGSGMDAETLARATEPFFTTKAKGKGTGLGLAMAKGFAEQSGGALWIDSEPGRGTAVTLWLPRAVGATAAAEPPANGEAHPAAPSRGGGRRVLLVDDEALVRSTLADALRAQGFEVEEADGGQAALARLGGPGSFDLLVTDLAMPGMDGLELLREVRRRCPGLPALVVTGYAGDADAAAFAVALGGGPMMLLRKPIDPDELTDRALALLLADTTVPTCD